jgi:nitrogen regulatory protein P-II 1
MGMKKIEVIIRPEKLDTLKKILARNEYSGLTVMTAMGCGHQKGLTKEFSEIGLDANLLPKLYVMTVIWEEDLEDILAEIREKLSTGNVGDGKVFISDMQDVMRIRTGERGEKIL